MSEKRKLDESAAEEPAVEKRLDSSEEEEESEVDTSDEEDAGLYDEKATRRRISNVRDEVTSLFETLTGDLMERAQCFVEHIPYAYDDLGLDAKSGALVIEYSGERYEVEVYLKVFSNEIVIRVFKSADHELQDEDEWKDMKDAVEYALHYLRKRTKPKKE